MKTPDDWDQATITFLVIVSSLVGGVTLMFGILTLSFYFFE